MAGAFGVLGMVREPVALIRREVERLRALGYANFGVNIIPAATEPALLASQVAALIELQVPAVSLFWDLDVALVRRLRDAGIKVIYQVGSIEEAAAAEQAGAQLIIAQGVEAGGHVRGTLPLCQLLPGVLNAVNVPVLAAGGLATGDDLVTARAYGADGVVLGTVLAAAEESFAHPYHKHRLVLGTAGDTLLTKAFHINWPIGADVRVLASAVTSGECPQEQAEIRHVIGEEEGRPIYLFSTDSPLRSMTGDFESMALYAGTGVGSIAAIRAAGEIIGEIAASAEVQPLVMDDVTPLAESASPVCYVGEMSGAYVGQLEPSEVAEEIATLLPELRAVLCSLSIEDASRSRGSTLPFSPRTATLARWIIKLNGALGSGGHHIDKSGAVDAAAETALRHIRNLAPRLPEGVLRSELANLRAWLEDVQDASASGEGRGNAVS
jgi:nitronate monooxygenase